MIELRSLSRPPAVVLRTETNKRKLSEDDFGEGGFEESNQNKQTKRRKAEFEAKTELPKISKEALQKAAEELHGKTSSEAKSRKTVVRTSQPLDVSLSIVKRSCRSKKEGKETAVGVRDVDIDLSNIEQNRVESDKGERKKIAGRLRPRLAHSEAGKEPSTSTAVSELVRHR